MLCERIKKMQKLTDRRKINGLMWLCSIAYFISYISRINLSAALVEMVACGFAGKTEIALALTVCSVTYGVGQIISGFLGDKFKPQNVMFVGFLITAAMNFGVFQITDSSYLYLLWAINGFAQALMWPPIVAITSSRFEPDDYKKSCVRVSWGSSFGTIAVYLFAPVIISTLNFRYIFLISSIAAFAMAIIWKIVFTKVYECDITDEPVKEKEIVNHINVSSQKFDKNGVIMLGFVMLITLLQGSLRDGVSNWMPSFVSDTFKLSSSASILTGVILPVFSIVCFQITSRVYKKLKNEMVCAGTIFGAGAIASLLISVFYTKSMIFSVILLAVLSGAMHGVNMMLTCMMPPQFKKYGHVSLTAGLVNSCTYAGSAVSTYGIAVFSDKFGWSSTLVLWTVIAAAGTGICIIISKAWKRFTD